MATRNIQVHISSTNISMYDEDLHICIDDGNKVDKIPLVLLESIIIHVACKLSSTLLSACAEYRIDIRTANKQGISTGRWYHDSISENDILQCKQYAYITSPQALRYVCLNLLNKFEQQLTFLKNYFPSDLQKELIESEIKIKPFRSEPESILSLEAIWTKQYYQMLNLILPPEFQFKSRSRRPALDPFNSMLNYGYSILYHHCEHAITRAGLSPYLGILHGMEKGGKAFLYDFIECFRPWLDEYILKSILERKIESSEFEKEGEACLMIPAFRKKFIAKLDDWMYMVIVYQNRRLTRLNHIYDQAERVAKEIKKIRIQKHESKRVSDLL
ncbi:MAG: CRISPR-associated endonuclease Cas1 [Saprospiraceae bacterium]|nr:CRISPR-associated endonuclease Cas1 [Saprospiraceae bacterium]